LRAKYLFCSWFERDLLIERTNAGISRMKAAGKACGRPSALSKRQQAAVASQLAAGVTVAQIARDFKTSRQIVIRVRAAFTDQIPQ
jgi:putative DNA-invertase from lambdoid prophage Rac